MVTSLDVMSFVYDIQNTKAYKKLYTDVWLDVTSVQNLFNYVNNSGRILNKKCLITKLNFIADSKTFGLHKKIVWNKQTKVSVFICI